MVEEIVTSTPFWIEVAAFSFFAFLLVVLINMKTNAELIGTAAFFLAGWTGISCYFLHQIMQSTDLNPWLAPILLVLTWVLSVIAVVAALVWFFRFLWLTVD